MNTIPVKQLPSSTDIKTKTVNTTCPYCGVGCGVSAQVTETTLGQKVTIEGDVLHPSNFGKLCIKGSNLADTLGLKTRLLQPQIGRKNNRNLINWNEATQLIADQFKQCIDHYGKDSIAFYVSGQLLTEDYYVVNKFVKGYLGTANIDTNSRLCMSSAVAAHKRAFGEDLVPASYEDFEHTEMVVLVGSNTAWCHPVLYQRIMKAKEERDLFVVVIDPRFTATCEAADLHLPILIGKDVSLFNGLLQYLYQNNMTDTEFVNAHTKDLDLALESSMNESNLEDVAIKTGISLDKLSLFFDKFAQTKTVMTLFSMGVNQSSQGVDKANSIINCHLITGKIGKLGSAPFSMTGQPNAMGGREVGGLANMLAAHMELENIEHQNLVQGFWNSPHIAKSNGLKAVDLFEAVESGKIKAIWIMATNPVVSLPNADQVKRALEKCNFVVVSDICQDTDTTQYADVLLPALSWGEKDGTVTSSERCISRQRQFLNAPELAQPDWWAISQVAKKMGFEGFDFESTHEIFVEHAKLSGFQNIDVSRRSEIKHFRYFNLSGLSHLTSDEYNQLKPIQWPYLEHKKSDNDFTRLFSKGEFSHHDGKAKFIATVAKDPVNNTSSEYPLILNTGRIRDQWHTMTRTALSANLATHRAEPFCEIHPNDALKFGIRENDLVEIKSFWGSCVLRAVVSDHIRRGQIFAPIHWNDQFASDARIGKVVNPVVDPISGEPEFKHTPVIIHPFYIQWQGVVYIREGYEKKFNAALEKITWWTKVKTHQAFRYELSGRQKFSEVTQNIKVFLPFDLESFEWLSLDDPSANINHSVILKDGILIASLYIAPQAYFQTVIGCQDYSNANV